MMQNILLLAILGLLIYHFYQNRVDLATKKIEGELLKYLTEMSERQQHNLIVALKSHTVDDYQNAALTPPLKEDIKIQAEDPFMDLNELAELNPEEFDKKILG